MQFSKALFCFALLFITATLAEFRHIPDRSKMFSEERPSKLMPFSRNLEGVDHNSHNKSTSHKKAEPVTVRLQGSTELGYYYVTLFMGTPIQKQTLIVDTGSVTTTVPCVECGHECGTHHFDKPFNNDNSKSFEKFKCNEDFGKYTCSDCDQHCRFTVSYVEGSSYSGHFNKDFVVFGNEIEDNFPLLKSSQDTSPETAQLRESIDEVIENRKVFMPFGCTNRETKLFYDQEADGILGLGVNTNTHSSPPNILDALNIQNKNFSKVFSLCLAQDGGYFTLGGHNSAYHLPGSRTQYTEYSDAFGQYKVFISKIEIEGENVGLKPAVLNSGEGAFFDSGTTLTHVPSATYNALRSNIKKFCGDDDKRCGKNSETKDFCWRYNHEHFSSLDEFYESFPTFTVHFGREEKSIYDWKAQDYLYEKEDGDHEYCLGLSHYERETILGGTFMKNHDVLFDKEKKRIGFARADCTAVQSTDKPDSMDKKESIQPVERPETKHEVPPETITTTEKKPNDNTLEFSMTFDRIVKAAIAIIIASAVAIAIVCACRRYKKRRTYFQVRNVGVEIASAGVNGRPLNGSPVQTPELHEQPSQDEKLDVDSHRDDTNPEIRVD